MKLIKNKKGVKDPVSFVMAMFFFILMIIFLTGGGIGTAFEITKFLASIPTPVWIIFGIIFLLKLVGGKK